MLTRGECENTCWLILQIIGNWLLQLRLLKNYRNEIVSSLEIFKVYLSKESIVFLDFILKFWLVGKEGIDIVLLEILCPLWTITGLLPGASINFSRYYFW